MKGDVVPATSFQPDPKNANRGTKRGLDLLERSIEKYGAGRSILVDKHGVVIAGNKTLQSAADKGLPVQIVKSDGHTLVAVQRTDLDLSKDKAAKELAIADNRVAEVDLEWDADVLKELAGEGVDLNEFFDPFELSTIAGDGIFAAASPQQEKVLKDAKDIASTIDAMRKAKREHMAGAEKDADANFMVVLVFPDEGQQTEFLKRWGQDPEAKYLSGVLFNDALVARCKG